LLSVVSVWGIVIKAQLGKLTILDAIPRVVSDQVAKNSIHLLEVQVAHVYAVSSLPQPHKDPFDRLLVAQAIEEEASLVTSDSVFSQYPVAVEW
jgi:PIN domain nuclease of toxin-antitoxin system